MKRVNYHLTEKQIESLKQLADTTGMTVAEHIRRAVDDYLDKHARPTEVPPQQVTRVKRKP